MIPPYTFPSVSLKSHGNSTSGYWFTLGRFPSCQQITENSWNSQKIAEMLMCFSYFLWFAFSAEDQILQLLTVAWNPITLVMYQMVSLASAVVWLTLEHLSWVLVGLWMTSFEYLKRKFNTQPLGTLTQMKIDMVVVYSSLKWSFP